MKFFVILALCVNLLFAAIDINTASEKDLSSLTGIGTKKASAIIKYREINCFENIAELVNVKGIGQKTFEKNMDNLSVSKCEKIK